METRERRPVVIVGGGLAGLAAAVELSGAGVPVVLLEQGPSLGGRARSYTDPVTGDEIDNGQHLLIAGYTHTLAFLERVGTRHLVEIQDRPVLHFHHPERGFVDFRLPHLPPPLNALWAILTTSLIAPPDRFALLRAGGALFTGEQPCADHTVTQWLDLHRQTREARRCFWDPLTIAIMNEHADFASAQLFVSALRQAFLRHNHHAALVFPRVGLSRLFAEPARSVIERAGGTVRCNAGVARVAIQDHRTAEVVLRDGSRLCCSAVILAVPPAKLPMIIPAFDIPGLPTMVQTSFSPIIGIHLWMEHAFLKVPAIGLIGRRVQWVFRRERHLSLVISAAREFIRSSHEELTAMAVEDLRAVFGASVGVPTHSVVIKEKRATCSLTPAVVRQRLQMDEGTSNLFLCGDWTNTGLPATIEGAILSGQRSGRLAVHCV